MTQQNQQKQKFWLVRSKYRENFSRVVSLFETEHYQIKVLDVITKKNEALYIITAKHPSILQIDYLRNNGMTVYVLQKGCSIIDLVNDVEYAKELEGILPEIDKEAVKLADIVRADLSAKN